MIDAYLKIGDIKGESQDEKHKQWIEVSNVQWGGDPAAGVDRLDSWRTHQWQGGHVGGHLDETG